MVRGAVAEREGAVGIRKAIVVGVLAGLIMGVFLFVVGGVASRVVYGPQMAPEGKFDPEQLNAWYFIWTKLVMGVFFGVLFALIYEALPLSRRISSVLGGLKYAFWLWVVVYLWGLSHPLMYETLDVRNQVFWLIYTLGGFVGYGLAFGQAYKRHALSAP